MQIAVGSEAALLIYDKMVRLHRPRMPKRQERCRPDRASDPRRRKTAQVRKPLSNAVVHFGRHKQSRQAANPLSIIVQCHG
jgi:hypothetical protein